MIFEYNEKPATEKLQMNYFAQKKTEYPTGYQLYNSAKYDERNDPENISSLHYQLGRSPFLPTLEYTEKIGLENRKDRISPGMKNQCRSRVEYPREEKEKL